MISGGRPGLLTGPARPRPARSRSTAGVLSDDADATRATLAKVLGTRTVDAGGGWLIFALPPAELAVHPATRADGSSSTSLLPA